MACPSSSRPSAPSSPPATRYGEAGFTRTDTIVRLRSYGPPVNASSSGGRRLAASPSSASGRWSKEKMKYDFGLTSPSRLSLSADSSNAMPVRSRSSFSTASRGTCGNRSISDSTSAVREVEATVPTSARYPPPVARRQQLLAACRPSRPSLRIPGAVLAPPGRRATGQVDRRTAAARPSSACGSSGSRSRRRERVIDLSTLRSRLSNATPRSAAASLPVPSRIACSCSSCRCALPCRRARSVTPTRRTRRRTTSRRTLGSPESSPSSSPPRRATPRAGGWSWSSPSRSSRMPSASCSALSRSCTRWRTHARAAARESSRARWCCSARRSSDRSVVVNVVGALHERSILAMLLGVLLAVGALAGALDRRHRARSARLGATDWTDCPAPLLYAVGTLALYVFDALLIGWLDRIPRGHVRGAGRRCRAAVQPVPHRSPDRRGGGGERGCIGTVSSVTWSRGPALPRSAELFVRNP